MPPLKTDFNIYLQKEFAAMRIEGLTEETVKTHASSLPLFFRFLESHDITKLADVTTEHIDAYQNHLFFYRMENGKPYSVWTQVSHLSILSSFFRRLTNLKLLISNPATNIQLPKRSQRLPKGVLTTSELKKFISQPDRTTVYGFRDYCMISVFMSTGVRTSECCNFKVSDIDFDHGFIMVREGKGLKDGNVPCSEPVLEDLRFYVDEIRPYLVKENSGDYLFISKSGRAMDKHSVYCKFRKYSKTAKLKRVIIPRYFRYTISTEMIRKNPSSSLRETQMLLRHGSLSSLDAYIQVLQKDLKREYRKRHPTARGEVIG